MLEGCVADKLYHVCTQLSVRLYGTLEQKRLRPQLREGRDNHVKMTVWDLLTFLLISFGKYSFLASLVVEVCSS